MNVSGYSQISPGGLSRPTWTTQQTNKIQLTHIRGNHTIAMAFDQRNQYRTGGGNTSGNFTFN